MDLSLDDLLSGLEAVQHKKSQIKLSDRNVVELVNKLRELSFISEDELLHTSDGREYVTREKLEEETRSSIEGAGGRLPLVDLPAMLNVDLSHCERAAQEIVARSEGDVFLAQGELFTARYFDTLAGEIHQELQESGVVMIGDLARRYAVAVDIMSEAAAARMEENNGSGKSGRCDEAWTIRGRFENGVLYTDVFIARMKARLRGALRGALAPVSLPALRKSLGISSLGALASMVPSLIEELQKEGFINGKLMSGGSTWIPAVHAKMQQESLLSFYRQNGRVEFDIAARYGIANPKEFLNKTFPEGLILTTSFVSPSVAHEIDAAVEEAINSNSWCDLSDAASVVLSEEDLKALLQLSDTIKNKVSDGAMVLAETCFVSTTFLESLKDVLATEARASAKAAAAAKKRYVRSTTDELDDKIKSKQKKKSSNKPSNRSMTLSDGDDDGDDDSWETTTTGGRKGKKAGGKGGRKSGGQKQTSLSHKTHKHSSKGGTDDTTTNARETSSALSAEAITARILELRPELEGAGIDGELPSAIAAILRPHLISAYEKALADIFTAGANRRKELREAASKRLEEQYRDFQMHMDGIGLFEEDESTQGVLDRHLVRTIGARCIDALLHVLDADVVEERPEGGSATTNANEVATMPLAPSRRLEIARDAPSDVRAPLEAAVAALTASNTTAKDFLHSLEDACSAAGVGLRRVDKKQSSEALESIIAGLRRRVVEAEDPPTLLAASVPLLLAEKRGMCVSVPGRALGAALDVLEAELTEDEMQSFREFHAAVVEHLRSASTATSETSRSVEEGGKDPSRGEFDTECMDKIRKTALGL